MVFKCQEDSYLREFVSKVISCEKTQVDKFLDGKKVKTEAYEVILNNTILFPEGGGQPTDYGFLNDIPVTQVIRRSDKAIHFTEKPLNIGDEVKQIVNWERRFDHMQQHSGQHLLSAILDREFKMNTVSWWLGEDTSYVELDTSKVTGDQIIKAEDIINGLIREQKKVTVKIFAEDAPEEQLKEARSTRGLPEDHKGDIRVIVIEDIDENMCCGTHVTNLSQLQVVKLLHTEKSKRKDNILLHFLVGNRVLQRLSGCINREQKMVSLLKSHPSQHADLVDKLQKNVKIQTKNLQSVLKDLALLEAVKLNETLTAPSYFSLHRKEAEPDFMNTFIRELGERKDIFLFLSTGDEQTIGNVVLYGEESIVSELGPKICEVLEGKGAGKGNKFNAKCTKMANRFKAEELIHQYFKDNQK